MVPVMQLAPLGLAFQNGEFSDAENKRVVVSVLQIFLNGVVIISQDTNRSDLILDNTVRVLDERLGFRFGQSEQHRSHVSNVVVAFDFAIEERIDQLIRIKDIVIRTRENRNGAPLAMKRLAFGIEESPVHSANPLRMDYQDFSIERRVGTSFATNRYFCGAPLSTEAHIEALREIEEMLRPPG